MWSLYALIVLNALAWGLPVVASPGNHLTPIGSYPYWWYDDFPWLALAVSVVAPAIGLAIGRLRRPSVRRLTKVVTATTLCAFVPWACMAGGGL